MTKDKHWIKHPFNPIILKIDFLQCAGNFWSTNWQKERNWERLKYKHFLIKNNRENESNDHSFPYLPISLLEQTFFCRLRTGPTNVNMRFQTLCIILYFLSCFALQSYIKIHMKIKTYLCSNFLAKFIMF